MLFRIRFGQTELIKNIKKMQKFEYGTIERFQLKYGTVLSSRKVSLYINATYRNRLHNFKVNWFFKAIWVRKIHTKILELRNQNSKNLTKSLHLIGIFCVLQFSILAKHQNFCVHFLHFKNELDKITLKKILCVQFPYSKIRSIWSKLRKIMKYKYLYILIFLIG